MSLDTYRVTCAHEHDAVTLTGADALSHVQDCYGRKKLLNNRAPGAGSGWERSGKGKPWPWRAPKPDADGLPGVMRRIRAGEYAGPLDADRAGCSTDGSDDQEGSWRYDKTSDSLPPLHVLPAAVRKILETAMRTDGVRWMLKVTPVQIFVTVARTPDDQTRIRLRGRNAKVTVGSYRKPSTLAAARRAWLDGAA